MRISDWSSDVCSSDLQVSQATNQLIALSTKQQLQIQQMMAAQYRADAIEQARQQQAMEAARERTKRFIGAADIYTRNCQRTAKRLTMNPDLNIIDSFPSGKASVKNRVGQTVEHSVGGVSLKKKKKKTTTRE